MNVKILFIAAECKPFSKAGGVGDVVGELPPALRELGLDVEVVTPLYEIVPKELVGVRAGSFEVHFNGVNEEVDWFKADLNGVRVHLLGNNRYFGGNYGSVYFHSGGAPFEDDAKRFSFFSKAALVLVKRLQPTIVHIHDWVLGYLFGWMKLQGFPQKRVLTIHNVGYQGNLWKPLVQQWDINSLLESPETEHAFTDPRRDWDSVNALALAVNLADLVTTVSPTYAAEIQQPEDAERFFEGGKGLDPALRATQGRGRLVGILNGFSYPSQASEEGFSATLARKRQAKRSLAPYFRQPSRFTLGFVGRAVEQKFKLLREMVAGQSVLEHILDIPNVNVAVLATGLPEYEAFIGNVALERYGGSRRFDEVLNVPRRSNYLCALAFDKDLAGRISLASDGFLMPSLFEPCGITQLEAMSNATPPLVRLTGGLVDTVIPHPLNSATGFGFSGSSRTEVLSNLIENVRSAAELYEHSSERFLEIQRNAYFTRFTWADSAEHYRRQVYGALTQ